MLHSVAVRTSRSARSRPGEPDDHAIGRSRGGLTTKIHLAADDRCRPLAFHLTAGQAGDTPAFTAIMARLRVPRQRGRPRTRLTWSWPTRPTPPARSASIYANAASEQ